MGKLVDVVRGIPEDPHHGLLVGHNPGITDFANYLVNGPLEYRPTCGVFSVEFRSPLWREPERDAGLSCRGRKRKEKGVTSKDVTP